MYKVTADHNKGIVEKDYKVIAVTPAGRPEYLDILKAYIKRDMDKGIIDEWHIWQNTNDSVRVAHIEAIRQERPEQFIVKTIDVGDYSGYTIAKFYVHAQDEDAIYVRMDDDIVYVREDAVENILNERTSNQIPFLTFFNIVNNCCCDTLHQMTGALSKEKGEVQFSRMDELGWNNPPFCKFVHETFAKHYNEKTTSAYLFPPTEITDYTPFSINGFAFFGRDIKAFGGVIPTNDEEVWLSQTHPAELGRPNIIAGNALIVHFAFYTQRPWLVENSPETLKFYQDIIALTPLSPAEELSPQTL